MKTIMIIIAMSGSWDGGVAIHHIEFENEGACRKARIEVLRDNERIRTGNKHPNEGLSVTCNIKEWGVQL